ncbi:protein translocase subunit SecD [Thalassotalea sp. HSM 43]|uniref:protein translocase subunit SecD n=1 Tax=Thalassotalea sp. HSM 43 TaxID=2552945 RepID=UPI0010800FA5|nr:protein translocase subunit SecD [Thalassotalea sp. HSM 43]QBY05170.1 protein translocase subunit SecD [Thalassotalea sp. HSM 43]
MLNKYPLWKNLMVVFIVAIAALYALPNYYGEDPAVQVSGTKGVQADAATLDAVTEHLNSQGIAYSSAALKNGQVLVRFSDYTDQQVANESLAEHLGREYSVALNLTPATPDWLASLGGAPMKLGLDLSGGVHFLMEVDMATAMSRAQENMVGDFRTQLRAEKIRYRSVKESGNGVEIVFRNVEDIERAETVIKRTYADYLFSDNEDRMSLKVTMSDAKLKETREYALQQNITIIRNRVNELGVAEPLVQRQGAKHIVVELPGIQDTARAKEILGATATLQFHMVDQERDVMSAVNGRVPPGSFIVNDQDGRPQLLKKRIMLRGEHIVNAKSSLDQETSRPQVNIDLDNKGGSLFSNATKDNIGKPMATVFIESKAVGKNPDGSIKFEKELEVISVATIQARLGKSFRITGQESPAAAHNLALLLRAGALIAPIAIVEERTVGPSLGAENVELGMQAIMWGFVLVLAFMVIYYRKFGLVANTALAANLILIVGVMSLIPGATLTLPGMAGIVLTVGMAVDANVLIFERIREELREGQSVQQAIHRGYDSAFSTILDANITTLIASIILFAVGTGPIKGFAVTLSIGIITSMFTSIVGTRAVVNAVWGGKRLNKLSI